MFSFVEFHGGGQVLETAATGGLPTRRRMPSCPTGKEQVHPVADLAPSRRLLVQETDQGDARLGDGSSVGHNVPVLEFRAVECGVVIQILSQGGSFQGNSGK